MAWEQSYAALTQVLSRDASDTPPGHKRDLYRVCGLQGADAALARAVHRLPIITIARSAGIPVHAVWINVTLEYVDVLCVDDSAVGATAM